ncbi:MAG: hypothetical protein JWM64_2662 [Frankiales bacterium]|nr:hypothetical protein [Frankiales bacterium]
MRAALLLVAGLLVLPACTDGGDDGVEPLPTIQTLPPETTPPPVVPTRTDQVPPLVLPSRTRDLAAGGNDKDASLTRTTLTVTVPAGSRLSITGACQGSSTLTVETDPDSKAGFELPCGPATANEITVQEATLLTSPKTYRVRISAPAPARYYVAAGAVNTRVIPG